MNDQLQMMNQSQIVNQSQRMSPSNVKRSPSNVKNQHVNQSQKMSSSSSPSNVKNQQQQVMNNNQKPKMLSQMNKMTSQSNVKNQQQPVMNNNQKSQILSQMNNQSSSQSNAKKKEQKKKQQQPVMNNNQKSQILSQMNNQSSSQSNVKKKQQKNQNQQQQVMNNNQKLNEMNRMMGMSNYQRSQMLSQMNNQQQQVMNNNQKLNEMNKMMGMSNHQRSQMLSQHLTPRGTPMMGQMPLTRLGTPMMMEHLTRRGTPMMGQTRLGTPMMMGQMPPVTPMTGKMPPVTPMMGQMPPVTPMTGEMHPTPPLQQQQVMNNNQKSQMNNRSSFQMMMMSQHLTPPLDQFKDQNPTNFPGFVPSNNNNQLKPMGMGDNNSKGKMGNDKRKDISRKESPVIGGTITVDGGVGGGGSGGYKPPTLKELQHQNRLKARSYFPKKKSNNRFAPYAPRNTTSFIIRAKKSGGIASLVSPCPVTPAVLPTPIFSPSREVLVDTAKEEWGVDGYGSMKGLIRLRSPGNDLVDAHEDEEEDEGGSSESDVEEHLEVERRLDHDLSRFEMISPNYGAEYNNVLENRVDDQDMHIAQVEEENMFLKQRLFLVERELADSRRRLMCLERQNQVIEELNEEVMENESDNESESRGYSNEEVIEENNDGDRSRGAEGKNIYHDVELKEANGKVEVDEAKAEENGGVEHVETEQEHNDEYFEVREAKDVERSNNIDGEENLELREDNEVERSNNVDVEDVCMEELVHDSKVTRERQLKGEGVGNESS